MKDRTFAPLLSLFLLQLFLSSAQAFETWSFPIENEMKTLQVLNTSDQPQLFWLKGPPGSEETSFEVAPLGAVEIPLLMFQGQPWMKLQSEQKSKLRVQVESLSKAKALIHPGSSTRWKVRTRTQNELVLFNQAPYSQTIEIKSARSTESVELAGYEKKRIHMPSSGNHQNLSLSGEARFSGLLLTSAGPKSFTVDSSPAVLQTPKNLRYFRVTNRSQSQSYIVALGDRSLIDQALKQISSPQSFQPRILVAQVDLGHGQMNRDFSTGSKTPWSWHVSEVFRFAELASQDCDGSPEFIEENIQAWVTGRAVICFWNYRIAEELKAEQVSLGQD